MKTILAIILSVVLFSSCQFDQIVEHEFDIPDLGLETLEETLIWPRDNITYISDNIHDVSDYWQNPYQTYIWRTGDCEDFVIILMYLINRNFDLTTTMILGRSIDPEDSNHAWLSIDGVWYEALSGRQIDYFLNYYTVFVEIDYEEVMHRSATRHRSIAL